MDWTFKISYVRILFLVSLLLNQARDGLRLARDFFLEITFVRGVSMCLCVSAPEAINYYWLDRVWYGAFVIS